MRTVVEAINADTMLESSDKDLLVKMYEKLLQLNYLINTQMNQDLEN